MNLLAIKLNNIYALSSPSCKRLARILPTFRPDNHRPEAIFKRTRKNREDRSNSNQMPKNESVQPVAHPQSSSASGTLPRNVSETVFTDAVILVSWIRPCRRLRRRLSFFSYSH